MDAKQRAEILENAARAMQVRGGCVGDTMNAEGQVCAVGAIGLALGWTDIEVREGWKEEGFNGFGLIMHELEDLGEHIFWNRHEEEEKQPELGPRKILSIITYNDAVEDETLVVKAMKERAEYLRSL